VISETPRIRFGGKQGAEEYQFEFSGGHPALDFANTVGDRPTAPRELLRTYADVLAWARQAGLISIEQHGRLGSEARARPREAGRVLSRARALREAIQTVCSAAARGEPPAAATLEPVNAEIPAAQSRQRLAPAGERAAWAWSDNPRALDAVLWPIVRAAADLLTSADLSLVRECADETCRWLFLDRSRNRSRRWCDMTVCGNRAKARRHYARVKRIG
jgi:predicted RNA-binding Zn ribbon-like protein